MGKGKCYSQCNRGQRLKNDMYRTPFKITESLFEKEMFDFEKTVLEPCIGEGDIIIRLFKKFKYKNVYGFEIMYGTDFFKCDEKVKYNYIITNPPFSKSNQFILKAKKVCDIKFAFLMKLNYLQGQWRYENIYNVKDNFPLTKVYIYTRMPTLEITAREDGKYFTGMQAMAWYIWEKKNKKCLSKPVIKWIDSKGHIIRKGE